jgi:tetratricopeptide (TPR) repeat protein
MKFLLYLCIGLTAFAADAQNKRHSKPKRAARHATFTKNVANKDTDTNDTTHQVLEKKAAAKLYFGGLYQGRNEFDRAETALLESLSLYESLEAIDKTAYEFNRTKADQALGDLYTNIGNYEKARAYYEKARIIRTIYGKRFPKTYSIDLANTLTNIASLDIKEGLFSDAETSFTEAVNIYAHLQQDAPQLNIHEDFATVLSNLGDVYTWQRSFIRAESTYAQAISVCKEATEHTQSRRSEPFLANLHAKIANVYTAQNNGLMAESSFLSALEMYRKWVNAEPAIYEPFVADVQYNLGKLYVSSGKNQLAEIAYQEALTLHRKLIAINKELYEPMFATTQHGLANFYVSTDNWQRAKPLLGESIRIFERYAKTSDIIYEPQLAQALFDFGLAQVRFKEFDAAAVNLTRAKTIASKHSYMSEMTTLVAQTDKIVR